VKLRFVFLCSVFLAGCHDSATAQTIKDPIRDYLFPRDLDRDADELDADLPDFQALYVLRCNLDESGKPAVLISFNAEGGHGKNYWTAYVPSSTGYTKVDDSDCDFIFSQALFYVGRIKSHKGLLAYLPGKGGGDLIFYHIVDGKLEKQKIGALDLSNPRDAQELEKYFGSAPNWKSFKEHPVQVLSENELRNRGYDIDAAISAARAADGVKTP
jgi:hypothetical protein